MYSQSLALASEVLVVGPKSDGSQLQLFLLCRKDLLSQGLCIQTQIEEEWYWRGIGWEKKKIELISDACLASAKYSTHRAYSKTKSRFKALCKDPTVKQVKARVRHIFWSLYRTALTLTSLKPLALKFQVAVISRITETASEHRTSLLSDIERLLRIASLVYLPSPVGRNLFWTLT